MISKCNLCYKKFLNPKELFYAKFLSDYPHFIYVRLTYTFNGKTFSRQTPVFRRGEYQLLTFPSGAIQVAFTVFNCKYNPPHEIYTRAIPNDRPTCYKIIGTNLGHITSMEIPC